MFVHVTVVPALTVSGDGWNEKFMMLTEFSCRDTVAVQLFEALTPVPFAVTVILSYAPANASNGTDELSVAVPLLPADTVTKVGEIEEFQLGTGSNPEGASVTTSE